MLVFLIGFATFMLYLYYFMWLFSWVILFFKILCALIYNAVTSVTDYVKKFLKFLIKQ